MGNEELLEGIKRNEKDAQRQWLHRYGEEVARFAFQYGVTTKDANEIATETFQQLFKDLTTITNEDELWNCMYEILIRKLQRAEHTTVNEFTFEEDEQLHKEIIQLPHIEKLVFLLTTFSNIGIERIAKLLKINNEEVTHLNQKAKMQLSDHQIEKRLELLQKSYHRTHFQIDETKAFEREGIKQAAYSEQSPKSSKRTIYMLVFGIMALIGITLYSFVTSESYQQAATEKWKEKMQVTYDQKRTDALEELGIESDHDALARFSGMFSSQYLNPETDAQFERFIKDIEIDLEQDKPIDKEEITEEFDEYIAQLTTPNEMVDALFVAPLTEDKQGSEAFIERYLPKRYILSTIYLEEIYEQTDMDLMASTGDEVMSLETILKDPNLLTDDIKYVIEKMAKQQLYVQGITDDYMEQEAFFQKLKASLHPDLGGYVTMLELSPYAYYWFSLNENLATSAQIGEMESTLRLQTSINVDIEQILQSQYGIELVNYISGTDNEIYNADGFVQDKVREKWFAFIEEENHPIATSIVQKMIEEFEESNWRYSENFIHLTPGRIWEVVQHHQRGQEDPLGWETSTEAHFQHVDLLNQGFVNMVDEVYEQLQQQQDDAVLNDVRPLTMIGLLVKASENEDLDILQHLYGENVEQVKIEEYMTYLNKKEISEEDYIYLADYGKEGGIRIGQREMRFRLMPAGDRWTIQSIHTYD